MAFNNLTAAELEKVAEFFQVDVTSANAKASKKELLAALASGDDPVTWEQYETIYKPTLAEEKEEEVVEEPSVVDEDKPLDVVLKMERGNGRFDIRGYTFTREHPFRPVTTEDADWIVMNVEGFRRATTQEVTDYYS